MPCINVREGEGVVIVYDLDQCGAPDTGAGGKLVLSVEIGAVDEVPVKVVKL